MALPTDPFLIKVSFDDDEPRGGIANQTFQSLLRSNSIASRAISPFAHATAATPLETRGSRLGEGVPLATRLVADICPSQGPSAFTYVAPSPEQPPPPPNSPLTWALDSLVIRTAFRFPTSLAEPNHFPTPILSPADPPNSPDTWPFEPMETTNKMESAGTNTPGIGSSGQTTEAKDPPKAPEGALYEIRAVPGKGFGCFAINEIKRGTRILAESPILTVERAPYFLEDIKSKYDRLSAEDKAKYFSLHSAHGQDPRMWPQRIHPTVPTLERMRIIEQHEARHSKQPSLISIFQTNAFEMNDGAAVFFHASRFNHRCNSNACFTWNDKTAKEVIHTTHDIKAGEEITLTYCDATHDKATRQYELKNYGFVCDCPACGDTDDAESFATKSAERRYRLMELTQEMRPLRGHNLSGAIDSVQWLPQMMEYIALLVEEDHYSSLLASAYLDLALVLEGHGELRMGKNAAEKALEVRVDCMGLDFDETEEFARVVHRISRKLEKQDEDSD
ncbi:SET domain-containing protein [Polyplosphaeria fusca]|uniref:SET domain-containing protein n=1 Tax=Polyplosphaeria fusca TaxID=682080 RepID=A0A9P4RAU4_9PLEO|nr:SET domain-containing protein [Polyplosphaeria fusca]